MNSPSDIERDLAEYRGETVAHPFWHYCRRCATIAKTFALFVVFQLVIEFCTFKPVHEIYAHMGWLK